MFADSVPRDASGRDAGLLLALGLAPIIVLGAAER
jgi:hypothetical protein